MTADLSFEALRGDDNDDTTLAYWLGVLDTRDWPPNANAAALHTSLSYQYDIEEQAGGTGRLFPEDAEWRRVFQPLAPVQLTQAWSPLPLSMELLGAPPWSASETGPESRAAALAWLPSALERLRGVRARPGVSVDQRRFVQLLTVAAMRGLERGKGILIVACPGWSYEHSHTFDAATEEHMRRAHFAVFDRHAADPTTGP